MTILAGARILADDIAALAARGPVSTVTRTAVVGPFTTTETALDWVVFTPVAGAVYTLWCATSLQSSVAGDLIDVRFRWQTGATLTAAGTEFHHQLVNADIAGKGQVFVTLRQVSGLSAVQTSIGITAVRNTGTGNIQSFGSASSVNVLRLTRDS